MPPEQKPAPGQRARQDALGNKLPDPAEELALIDKEIQELKVAFEQYFLGMDRAAPLRRRDLLGERIRRMKNASSIRNSALRFRLDQAHSKFQSYERMWQRTIHEIESGTYRRDVFKMKLRQKVAAEGEKAPVAAAPPPPPSQPALTDGQLRALYDTYVMARTRTKESTSGITFESLSATLRRQVPELLKRYDCKAIDFKVVIKDGKTLLKAVPRK